MFTSYKSLAAALLALTPLASAAVLTGRAHVEGDTFHLYAYNNAMFFGFPICEWNGVPYVVNFAELTDTSIQPQLITFTITNGVWAASTNSSTSTSARRALRRTKRATSAVNGTNGDIPSGPGSDDYEWSNFSFYGHTAIYKADDGTVSTLFSAAPYNVSGMWPLYWDKTGNDDTMVYNVALRDIPPSNSH